MALVKSTDENYKELIATKGKLNLIKIGKNIKKAKEGIKNKAGLDKLQELAEFSLNSSISLILKI